MLREMLNVLKIRAGGDFSMTKWTGGARNITANNIDQIIHTREEANYLCACIHYMASEMVSKSMFGVYYQDMTLSGILFTEENSLVIPSINFAPKFDAKKAFVNIVPRFDSIYDAKTIAVYLRHFIHVMERQASGDFSNNFYNTAGGLWNTAVRHALSSFLDSAITTREEANLMVALARLYALRVIETYPPHFSIFFRDMTMSYRRNK
uniref:Uncharacterized protein n=1 Tax=Panagrolaimus superbus TaxID=310955 RepID=A0A914Y8K1_9BILA